MHGRPDPQHAAIPLDAEPHDLHFDIEARSCLPIEDVGMHVYARHTTTEIMCVSWAVDHGPVRTWRRGDPVPVVWFEAARNTAWTAKAHNAPFEITMAEHKLHPVHGFPIIPPERCRCTMAAALALGLPAKLKLVAKVLGLEHQKDVAGERLMRKMTRPRKPSKGEDPDGGPYWHEEPDQLDRLCDVYCPNDVLAERDLDDRLPPLSDAEQAVWRLSNAINARGFFVDRPFALAARKIAQAVAPEIDATLAVLTGNVVTTVNQGKRLLTWLKTQGCEMDSLAREKVEARLESEDLTAPARQALELRHEGAQSATAKVDALLDHAGDDDRIRGAFKYHGASTGRWSGEGFQPQNLKRPETEPEGITAAIEAVATGDIAHVRALYPKPLAIVGDLSRSMIKARSGYRLISCDFSAIESRVTAWVAGEEWKTASYHRFDLSGDPRDEPYCVLACKIYRVADGSFTKKSRERMVGKTADLAFGFQGGLGAWRKLEPPEAHFTDTEVETFKNEWRKAHPKTKTFWDAIDRAAVSAVHKRGETFRCGRITLKCEGAILWLTLPSGRRLAYPFPRIMIDDRDSLHVVFSDNAKGMFADCNHGKGAYGGIWTENVVSAISRDLLVASMQRLESAGYPITLHVHDECVCEVPDDFGSEQDFNRLMIEVPDWAKGLPIAAGVWSGLRYRK
jgi:DNA polymerase bacteriophage-type